MAEQEVLAKAHALRVETGDAGLEELHRIIVALFTEPGLAVGMTADGGIIEGRTRTGRRTSQRPRG